MEGREKRTHRRRRRKSVEGREALVNLSSNSDSEKKAEPNRVLLDVIRDVDDPNAGAYRSLIKHDNNKKSWKAFKDRLSLKRASQAWISAMPDEGERRRRTLEFFPPEEEESGLEDEETRKVFRPQLSRMTSYKPPEAVRDDVPISDPPMRRPQMLRHNSSRLSSSSSMNGRQGEDAVPRVRFADQLAAEKQQIQRVVSSTEAYRNRNSNYSDEEEERGTGGRGGEPVKMSLMDLLEETDDQIGWASYMAELEEDEEEEDEGGEEQSCCICMVRHKGRASAPCGHTFCRLCSKELSVGRGNCPRCNGFVLEILEIF
ncbi:unnamed protein product [Rhodiola kirilowii]